MLKVSKFIAVVGVPLVLVSASCRNNKSHEDLSPQEDKMTDTAVNQMQTPPTPTPQMKAVLDELAAMGGKPIESLSAQEARLQPSPADAVKRVLEKQGKSTDPEPVGNVEEKTVPGPAGQIPIRVYTPNGNGPFPIIFYIHGGGWVIATNDTYDASPRALCNLVKAVVVSPEYRKGPENKFPAAHEDTFAAYKWVVQNAGQLKGNDKKIAVVGESAGGNMAAVIANRAKGEGVRPPKAQVLVYPVASDDMNSPSYQRNADAKPLNKPMMKWFGEKYLNTPAEMSKPWMSIVKADVKGVAPATIINAEIDPLCSDGEMYAKHLREAGVDVVQKTYKGVTHEFFGMAAVLPQAKEAQQLAADRLKAAFAD